MQVIEGVLGACGDEWWLVFSTEKKYALTRGCWRNPVDACVCMCVCVCVVSSGCVTESRVERN
jgi:hypothetical protein